MRSGVGSVNNWGRKQDHLRFGQSRIHTENWLLRRNVLVFQHVFIHTVYNRLYFLTNMCTSGNTCSSSEWHFQCACLTIILTYCEYMPLGSGRTLLTELNVLVLKLVTNFSFYKNCTIPIVFCRISTMWFCLCFDLVFCKHDAEVLLNTAFFD